MLWLNRLILVSLIITVILSVRYLSRLRSQQRNYPIPEAAAPQAGDRILVFSPHPDDESIAVGGYIYNACQNGAIVRIILVTDGNKQGLKEKRYAEFHQAAALLGISSGQLVFWDYRDGKVKSSDNKLFKQVEMGIDKFDPMVILYPHPSDSHTDHSALGCIVEKILSSQPESRPNILAYRYLIHHWFFPQPGIIVKDKIVIPPERLMGINHEWQQYILASEAKHSKKSAIYKYRSQLKNPFLAPLLLGFIRPNELLEKWSSGTSNLPDQGTF